MRYYFPEKPSFRFVRQKPDCQPASQATPVELNKAPPPSPAHAKQPQDSNQVASAKAVRPNESAHRVLDQIEAVHKLWTAPLSTKPATSAKVATVVTQATAKPYDPYDLQDVPDTWQAQGYQLGPVLLRRWFANPLYAVATREQKECLSGASFYPASLVDSSTLKLSELMKIERIAQACDKIKSPEFLQSKLVQDGLRRICSRLPEGYGYDVNPVKEFDGDWQKMHRRYAFASVTVGSRFPHDFEDIRLQALDKSKLGADDVTLALGEFRLWVAIEDAYVAYHGHTTRSVRIKELAIYIMAPYGFDTFTPGSGYMGHYNKRHLALVSDGDWVKTPIAIGSEAHTKNALMRPVSRDDLLRWRDLHHQGGDMLLFSERRPSFQNMEVVVPAEPSPTGTLYWGGAGLDGPYIQPTLRALQNAGISNVYVGLTNSSTRTLGGAGTIVDAFRAGLPLRYEDKSDWRLTSGMNAGEGQFNLIGYSYGSLLAAQTANYYASQGHFVDHLVLIASPIDDDFLAKLRGNSKIGLVSVINLTAEGDEIFAGMSQVHFANPLFIEKLGKDMLGGEGRGHFYYAHIVPNFEQRVKELAAYIYSRGLR